MYNPGRRRRNALIFLLAALVVSFGYFGLVRHNAGVWLGVQVVVASALTTGGYWLGMGIMSRRAKRV